MGIAAEVVDAAQVAVRDRQQRVQHRVDDGRLVAAGGVVAAHADLGQADAARLLEQVGHVTERGVEGVQGRVGLREVPDALLATLDGVLQHADRRGADGVLRRPGELLAGGEAHLQHEQVAVGLLNAAERNSRRQGVRNAREVGRNCSHGSVSGRRGQPACRRGGGDVLGDRGPRNQGARDASEDSTGNRPKVCMARGFRRTS